MKITELRNQTQQQLEASLLKQHQALTELKLKAATEEFKQHHQLRATRRQIAQIKTLIRSKQLVGDKGA